MPVTVLAVPGCPHLPVLGGAPGRGARRPAGSDRQPQGDRYGRRSGPRRDGSPTILIDGLDAVAVPGQSVSVSCGLYRGRERRQGRYYVLADRNTMRNVLGTGERPDLRLTSGAAVEQRPERLRAECLGVGLVQDAASDVGVLAGPLPGRGG